MQTPPTPTSPRREGDARPALEFLLARSGTRTQAVMRATWMNQISVTLIFLALRQLLPAMSPALAVAYLPVMMWLCAYTRATRECEVFSNLIEDGCWDEVRQTRTTMAEWVDVFMSYVTRRQMLDATMLLWLPVGGMLALLNYNGLARYSLLSFNDHRVVAGVAGVIALVWMAGLALLTRSCAVDALLSLLEQRRPSAARATGFDHNHLLGVVTLVLVLLCPLTWQLVLALGMTAALSAPVTLPLIIWMRTQRARRALVSELERSRWTEPVAMATVKSDLDAEPDARPYARVHLRAWSDNPLVMRDCIQESLLRDGTAVDWYVRHYGLGAMLATLAVFGSSYIESRGLFWIGLFGITTWVLGRQVRVRLGQKLAREHFGRTLEALRSTPFDSEQFVDGWAEIATVPIYKQAALVVLAADLAAMLTFVMSNDVDRAHFFDLAALGTLAAEVMLLGLLLPAKAYLYLQYLMSSSVSLAEAQWAAHLRCIYLALCLFGPLLVAVPGTHGLLTLAVLLLAGWTMRAARQETIEWDARGPRSEH